MKCVNLLQEFFEQLRCSCEAHIPGFTCCCLAPSAGSAPPAPTGMQATLRHAFVGSSADGPGGGGPPAVVPRGTAAGRRLTELAHTSSECGDERPGARDMRRISSESAPQQHGRAAAQPLRIASSWFLPGDKGRATNVGKLAAADSQRPQPSPPTLLDDAARPMEAPLQRFKSPFEDAAARHAAHRMSPASSGGGSAASGASSTGELGSHAAVVGDTLSSSGAASSGGDTSIFDRSPNRPRALPPGLAATPLTLVEARASMPCSLQPSAFVDLDAPEERHRSQTLSQRNAQAAQAALELLRRTSRDLSRGSGGGGGVGPADVVDQAHSSGGVGGGDGSGGAGGSLQRQTLPPNPSLAAASLGDVAEEGSASNCLPFEQPNPFLAALAERYGND